ncbi:MAG: SGNH hydrolase, partial [Arthrobacter sp.]|nr:SGNH hydrolase [Arthrobacter sp.]
MSDTSAIETPSMTAGSHPWSRYVAMGDSFTEGIGDP